MTEKKNVTVEQMIEHMTADIQNADGQYIQLGFTPPPTPNDNWAEFAPGAQNPFVPHFTPRTAESIPYMDPNIRYVNQNAPYNNAYMAYELPKSPYDVNKYVLYPNQPPPYPPVYMPVYSENRDYALFNQELQNIQMPVMPPAGQSGEIFMQEKYVHQPQPNRTHLIENLVCNWAQNTNGTYSPFGNPQHGQNVGQGFFESVEHAEMNGGDAEAAAEFNVKFKTVVNKKKQVAEVKPMRPTYSDVLAKSVPQPKIERTIDSSKDPTKPNNKNSLKKNNKNDKFSKSTPNRSDNFAQKFEKTDSKVNLPRKWVSLDDVNEVHASANDLFNVSPNQESVKAKKTVKREVPRTDPGRNGIKKSFLDNTGLECQWTESDDVSESSRNDEKSFKNPTKKGKDGRASSVRQVREKPPGSAKRNQRARRREPSALYLFLLTVQLYITRWTKIVIRFLLWLLHLVSDIFSMSVHLGRDFGTTFLDSFVAQSKSLFHAVAALLKRITIFTTMSQYVEKKFGRYFWKPKGEERRNSKPDGKAWLHSGLEHNITMPSTGEEAMKRLLACKGKDPYSILGVRPDCTDDDIKRYYKRQAFLVHPDKNPQPGAEEAFKILVHAFDIIGEPERRQSYDRKVAESHQVEQAWSELNDLLSQLHQKMEYAANTIRCTNCSKRHRRLSVDRPCYAARMCSQCKIHHSAKEGDIWAEAKYFGLLWHYYACMDGAVYDITEWAGCQRKNLKHLRPNNHTVQYRIVLGKQGQAGGSSSSNRRGHKSPGGHSEREADLENFLNNLYNQTGDMSGSANTPSHSDVNSRSTQDATRSRKKNKRKK